MNTNEAQAMQASFPWLTALILVALLGAVALWAVKPARKAALPFGVSLSALIFFAFLAAAAFDFDMDRAGTVQLSETYSWIPPIGASIAWGVNGMGLVMIGLATFLVPLVLLAARDELSDQGEDRAAGYVAWILALEAIVIAIFAARDVFLFYVLFELMILPVYVLVARYGGEGRHRAAIKFVLYSLFGGLVMLAGVIGLAVTASSDVKGSSRLFLVDTLAGHGAGPRLWIFASFFLAFAIKAPLFPVHTWLPDTAEQAPPGTSALLVGVLDKLGVFGMISLCLPIFPKASHDGAPLIMAIAVVSILWGAFMAIASKDLMRLVAYTSVSHFGFIVLGVFSGSHTAMTGAIVYMVAHGVATSALFLTVGFLGRRGVPDGRLPRPARAGVRDRRLRRMAAGDPAHRGGVPHRRPGDDSPSGPVRFRPRVPRPGRNLREAPGSGLRGRAGRHPRGRLHPPAIPEGLHGAAAGRPRPARPRRRREDGLGDPRGRHARPGLRARPGHRRRRRRGGRVVDDRRHPRRGQHPGDYGGAQQPGEDRR